MDGEQLDGYWRAITVIEAQQTLQAMRIADYPYQKKEERLKFHKEMTKAAYLRRDEARKVLTTTELVKRLGLATNG